MLSFPHILTVTKVYFLTGLKKKSSFYSESKIECFLIFSSWETLQVRLKKTCFQLTDFTSVLFSFGKLLCATEFSLESYWLKALTIVLAPTDREKCKPLDCGSFIATKLY